MSGRSEQSIYLHPLESPASGRESFSTAQQQPLESPASGRESFSTAQQQPLESPASGYESFSTAQQQSHEASSVDVEREATENALPSAKPFAKVYKPRPSILIVHITHMGKIVYDERFLGTRKSLESDGNLPDIPPKGTQVVIQSVGVDNQTWNTLT